MGGCAPHNNIDRIQMDIKLFEKIPLEILREEILPLTYRPQPAELCEDIRSYVECRNYLYSLYILRYNFMQNDTLWLEFLDNDIIRFMNNDIPVVHGFTISHVDKYKRLYNFNNKSDIYIRTHILGKMKGTQTLQNVNMSLGMLEPNEREEFITFAYLIQLQLGD